jgi:hypothetical protein
MSARDSSNTFMADPSLLLSPSGMWLPENPEVRDALVISGAFYSALAERQVEKLTPYFTSLRTLEEQRSVLLPVLGDLRFFSAHEATDLSDEVTRVRRNLLDSPNPAAEILADEWVYLATESWLASKRRYVLDKLRVAGAATKEYRERLDMRVVEAMIPEGEIPPVLTTELLRTARIKWLLYCGVVGGASAGGAAIGGVPGAAAGAVLGVLSQPLIQAFDP